MRQRAAAVFVMALIFDRKHILTEGANLRAFLKSFNKSRHMLLCMVAGMEGSASSRHHKPAQGDEQLVVSPTVAERAILTVLLAVLSGQPRCKLPLQGPRLPYGRSMTIT